MGRFLARGTPPKNVGSIYDQEEVDKPSLGSSNEKRRSKRHTAAGKMSHHTEELELLRVSGALRFESSSMREAF